MPPQSDIDEAMGRTVDGVAQEERDIYRTDVLKLAASVADAFRYHNSGAGCDAKQLALAVPSLLNGGRVETQATISAWAEATFGPAGSNARAVARANREMAELLEHVTSDDRHPEAADEIADVVIVLYRVATRLGVDLHERIDAKMVRNRARKWQLDGTGHGYHVKEPAGGGKPATPEPPQPQYRYIDRPNEYDPPTPAELEEHARRRPNFRATRAVHNGYRRCTHGTLPGCSECDWLAKIESLKPDEACEFRSPIKRDEWLPGTVVENNRAGAWRVRDAHGTLHALYIESIRLPGQEVAWT